MCAETSELINNNAGKIEEIEPEDTGYPETSFDPDKIRVDQQTTNLGYLIEMLFEGEIDLTPEFQRSMDLWDAQQKSQLIESLLLGLPLPSFYFSIDRQTNKWVIVDGLQRFCTFNDFIINNKLRLSGLEFLKTYEGKNFEELSKADKRKINGTKINFYVIEKQSPSYVKFLIFKRVNTGGLVLTPQEIRHALNQGIPSRFIEELVELEEFKQATDYKIPSKRMEDREFANRFVAFYLLGYDTNYKGELDSFLNDGMEALSTTTDDERAKIEESFRKSMELAYKIFGNDAFRIRRKLDAKRSQIAKALFDTISVNLAWLTDEQRAQLLNKKDDFRIKLIAFFNKEDSSQAITSATARKSNVIYRFELIKNMLSEIIAT
ncbi:MAG: DUF262 domain-containing protein [Candidatus Magnetominusculus sp. LBB02]|nr:DUF262 domain-containing protein [Candidatus Magnetominusculus sp. LBB02]